MITEKLTLSRIERGLDKKQQKTCNRLAAGVLAQLAAQPLLGLVARHRQREEVRRVRDLADAQALAQLERHALQKRAWWVRRRAQLHAGGAARTSLRL